jgi:hypothetical protein
VEAIQTMVRSAADFVEPSRLWAVYPPGDIANGYETPENRCAWSNPCFHAEDIAHEAAKAADNQEAEFQWQHEALARLILSWERWDEDRQEWQQRVEAEWIPRVLTELKNTRFNVPAYVARLRQEWIPWKSQQNETADQIRLKPS